MSEALLVGLPVYPPRSGRGGCRRGRPRLFSDSCLSSRGVVRVAHTLTFAASHRYDPTESGITVPIRLTAGQESVELSAKLDTGASCCIFPRGYGESLGLNVEAGLPQSIATATGSFLTYGHEISISALGLRFDVLAYFAADPHFSRNVLGRQGWLRQVRLGLVDYDGELFIGH